MFEQNRSKKDLIQLNREITASDIEAPPPTEQRISIIDSLVMIA